MAFVSTTLSCFSIRIQQSLWSQLCTLLKTLAVCSEHVRVLAEIWEQERREDCPLWSLCAARHLARHSFANALGSEYEVVSDADNYGYAMLFLFLLPSEGCMVLNAPGTNITACIPGSLSCNIRGNWPVVTGAVWLLISFPQPLDTLLYFILQGFFFSP